MRADVVPYLFLLTHLWRSVSAPPNVYIWKFISPSTGCARFDLSPHGKRLTREAKHNEVQRKVLAQLSHVAFSAECVLSG